MDELLGIEFDKFGNEASIFFCKGEDIPAKLNIFLLRQWAELIEDNHAPGNYIPDLNNKRIIYVKINDEIAGQLIWEWQGKTAYIIFTTISKKYKKHGLYSMMHKYYEDRIRNGGGEYSKSQLHIDNNRIIELSIKNGYRIEYYKMIKKI